VRSLLDRGVLALNSGFPEGNVLLICPPLIITDLQLEQAIERLKEAITEAAGNPI
jgi:4-aminobutyrate aminotransferase-like enzyme